jgi:Fe-S cluster biogenesis protein NfuA/nitrite reductase/ring-hydroxylating ferredoxin subunit
MAAVADSAAGPIERVQELTEHLDAVADPGLRALVDELTAAIVQMYGAGLGRMLELVETMSPRTPAGKSLQEAFAADGLVASLLLIHDLHPVPLTERVGQALDRVRPYMESHGGDVELLGIEDGVARLALHGSCRSCRASSATLELAVRQALEELCPDLEGMDVEGLAPEPELAGFPGVALPMAGTQGDPAWRDLEGVDGLAPQSLTEAQVGAVALVVGNVEGTLLAYRDHCAACGGRFAGAELLGATLVCPSCARGFVLTMAGRCADDDALQLEPVPLLRQGSRVQVALGAG